MATRITVDDVVATARLDLVVAPGAPGAPPPGLALTSAGAQSPQRLRATLDAASTAARAQFGDDHIEIRSLAFADNGDGVVGTAAELATTASVALAAGGYVD